MCEKDEDAGFVKGQTVFDIRFGEGVVVGINVPNRNYPVAVKFNGAVGCSRGEVCTLSGKFAISEARSLFFAQPIPGARHLMPTRPPRDKFSKMDIVRMDTQGGIGSIRYVANDDGGESVSIFNNGFSSGAQSMVGASCLTLVKAADAK